MRHTRNLLAKTFCFARDARWAFIDNREPFVPTAELKTLQKRCRHRPIIELQQAAQELCINLAQVGLHEC